MPSSYESGLKPCTPVEQEMVYVWYIPLVYGIMLILYQDWDHGIYMVYPNKRNSLYWDVHLTYMPWKYVHHNVLLYLPGRRSNHRRPTSAAWRPAPQCGRAGQLGHCQQ